MEELLKGLLVLLGGGIRVFFFGTNAENTVGAHRNLREQRFIGHAVIAVGVVGGDVTFVAPEKTNLVPPNGRRGCQQCIQALWSRATRECDRESSPGTHGLRGLCSEFGCRRLKQFQGTLQNANFRRRWHPGSSSRGFDLCATR